MHTRRKFGKFFVRPRAVCAAALKKTAVRAWSRVPPLGHGGDAGAAGSGRESPPSAANRAWRRTLSAGTN
ncbi:protein of unknown function [Burkholderia multivorans]